MHGLNIPLVISSACCGDLKQINTEYIFSCFHIKYTKIEKGLQLMVFVLVYSLDVNAIPFILESIATILLTTHVHCPCVRMDNACHLVRPQMDIHVPVMRASLEPTATLVMLPFISIDQCWAVFYSDFFDLRIWCNGLCWFLSNTPYTDWLKMYRLYLGQFVGNNNIFKCWITIFLGSRKL